MSNTNDTNPSLEATVTEAPSPDPCGASEEALEDFVKDVVKSLEENPLPEVQVPQEPEFSDGTVSLFMLGLNRAELIHLRNLMSIMLPPSGEETVGQQLARNTGLPFAETSLWQKISIACEDAGVAVGDEAPDFALAPSALPVLEVIQVNNIPEGVMA